MPIYFYPHLNILRKHSEISPWAYFALRIFFSRMGLFPCIYDFQKLVYKNLKEQFYTLRQYEILVKVFRIR
jgi:hypothetical protein